LQLVVVLLEGAGDSRDMANLLARALVSLVVPPVCVGCREPELSGSAVCPRCERLLVCVPEPRCLTCAAPVGRAGDRCGECRGRSLAFRCAWSAFTYEGVARRLVAALKSRGALSAAGFMGAQIAARAPGSLLEGPLVPVPAHRFRRHRHGFNQATELARAISRAAAVPVLDLLRRDAASVAQTGLERRARLANTGHSIGVNGRRLGSGEALPPLLVLVDDVYTTGATLDACARALREAGASEIVALTFARAVRNDGR
jgi:ComF family protein